MTWLELTNTVLKRLRENAVTTVSQTTYSALIGQFVNEAKREVEDAWDWNRLKTSLNVVTVQGTFNYTLTGAGKRFRVVDVTNVTQQSRMQQIGSTDMNNYYYFGTPQQGAPIFYNFNGGTVDDPKVDFFPIPDSVTTIRFNLVIPQADFTLDATGLLIPEWPVVLGAWSKAVSERGEDGGANSSEVDAMYRGAVADAVCQDAGLGRDELLWQAV